MGDTGPSAPRPAASYGASAVAADVQHAGVVLAQAVLPGHQRPARQLAAGRSAATTGGNGGRRARTGRGTGRNRATRQQRHWPGSTPCSSTGQRRWAARAAAGTERGQLHQSEAIPSTGPNRSAPGMRCIQAQAMTARTMLPISPMVRACRAAGKARFVPNPGTRLGNSLSQPEASPGHHQNDQVPLTATKALGQWPSRPAGPPGQGRRNQKQAGPERRSPPDA